MENKIESLKETSNLMASTNYKDRFIAEYYQVKIRAEKLECILETWDNLKFEPNCPKSILREQLATMKKYLQIMESRAVYEEIDLGIELLENLSKQRKEA